MQTVEHFGTEQSLVTVKDDQSIDFLEFETVRRLLASDREQTLVSYWGKDILLGPLPKDTLHALIAFIQSRDTHICAQEKQTALEQVIVRNIFLVVYCIKKYTPISVLDQQNPSFLEAVSHGVSGLETAIKKFNPEKITKFSTFAVYCIRGKLTLYLNNNFRFIRFPAWLEAVLVRLRKAEYMLLQKGEVLSQAEYNQKLVATYNQLVAGLKAEPITDKDLQSLLAFKAMREVSSLSVTSAPLIAQKVFIHDGLESKIISSDFAEVLLNLMEAAQLTELEKIVLILRNNLPVILPEKYKHFIVSNKLTMPLSREETAEILECSQASVSNYLKWGMEKLKSYISRLSPDEQSELQHFFD